MSAAVELSIHVAVLVANLLSQSTLTATERLDGGEPMSAPYTAELFTHNSSLAEAVGTTGAGSEPSQYTPPPTLTVA